METKGVVLCSVVALLGVVSAAAGFAAEAKRIKPSDVNFVTLKQCSYPRSAAFGLGFTAAAALLMAQIIINFATGCCFCCKRTRPSGNSNWTKAVFYNVTSWITFVIAFFLLLAASALNDQHDLETTYNGNYYCYVVKPGVFAGGAFLAALSVILGIFYYVTLNTGKSTSGPCGNAAFPPNPSQGGIAMPMAQPQFPPYGSQPPAFVHEDTHNRRQFT